MMDAKLIMCMALALMLAYYGNAEPTIFDITAYGATPDADIDQVN